MSGDIVGWVLLGGAVVTLPAGYWWMLNNTANFNATLKNTYPDSRPLVDGGDRLISIMVGVLCAAVWPLAWAAGLLYLIFAKVTILTPIAERRRLERLTAKEQQAELEQLRRKVREYEIKGGESL